MKKTFLLVVLMSLIGFNYVAAQSSLIATLSHENDVKVFYGASALKEAHEAAVGGDVITLSSGRFNAVDITKAITLRGAGMALDTVYHNEPTVLSGDFKICVAENEFICVINFRTFLCKEIFLLACCEFKLICAEVVSYECHIHSVLFT